MIGWRLDIARMVTIDPNSEAADTGESQGVHMRWCKVPESLDLQSR